MTIVPSDVLEVQKKLADFESMTWHEILTRSKHQHHTVLVEELSSRAQRRLEEIDEDDHDELVSLRLSGTKRIYGIRSGHVLDLLWWDPAHQVYPSVKRR